LPDALAEGLPWLVGLCLLAVVAVVALRDDGDRRAFSLAVVAAIALTPIVWLHYFALLVVPLALVRPTLSWAWLSMWVFWVTPGQENNDDLWRIVVAIAVTAVVAAVSQSSVPPGETP